MFPPAGGAPAAPPPADLFGIGGSMRFVTLAYSQNKAAQGAA